MRLDAQLRVERPLPLTFAELDQHVRGAPLLDRDLEELVRRAPELLSPDTGAEETLLIIGQQVQNQGGGRADLVAVDASGALVLIELKRDQADMVRRTEPFEWQALRYAASYALIQTPDDAAARLFAPYIARHPAEFAAQQGGLTPEELARRKLNQFLADNDARGRFNHRQRIVLLASSFDPQVLSACAWLASNGVDIRCIAAQPMRLAESCFLEISTLLPLPAARDFYVEVVEATLPSAPKTVGGEDASRSRAKLPLLSDMFAWGLVQPGDEVAIKNRPQEAARLLDADRVQVGTTATSPLAWAKQVLGWSSVNIYEWLIHQPPGKTLDQLRREESDRRALAAAPERPGAGPG